MFSFLGSRMRLSSCVTNITYSSPALRLRLRRVYFFPNSMGLLSLLVECYFLQYDTLDVGTALVELGKAGDQYVGKFFLGFGVLWQVFGRCRFTRLVELGELLGEADGIVFMYDFGFRLLSTQG